MPSPSIIFLNKRAFQQFKLCDMTNLGKGKSVLCGHLLVYWNGDLLLAKSQLELSKCLIKGQTNTNIIQGREMPDKNISMTPNFCGSQNHINGSLTIN